MNGLGGNVFIGVLTGVLSTLLVAAAAVAYRRHRQRKFRAFWSQFRDAPLSIVMTEYPSSGSELVARTAKQAAGGYLVSKGNAIAMAALKECCRRHVCGGKDVAVVGDKSGNVTTDNMVVVGSPANNNYARAMLESVSERYEFPFIMPKTRQLPRYPSLSGN